MKIRHTATASKAFDEAPEAVQKAFLKQIGFLKENLEHPSLHAKKYDEAQEAGGTGKERTAEVA